MGIYNRMFKNEKEAERFFETYLQPYENDAYQLILQYVKDPHLAEDLKQEAVYKAMKMAHQMRNRNYSRAWFLKIAVNEAKAYYRKKRNMPETIPLEECSQELYRQLPSALDELIRQHDATVLKEAIQQLDTETGIIFWLHVDRHDTFEQIGEIMGMRTKTVCSRYYRGREKIIAYLLKETASEKSEDRERPNLFVF